KHDEQQKEEGESEAAMRLGVHNGGEVEQTGEEQNGDDHETDGNFVGNHLRGRAQAAEERIFRIRCPASHDDAINAERGDGENVENADVNVRNYPAVVERNHRPRGKGENKADEWREKKDDLVRAGGD